MADEGFFSRKKAVPLIENPKNMSRQYRKRGFQGHCPNKVGWGSFQGVMGAWGATTGAGVLRDCFVAHVAHRRLGKLQFL